MGALAHPLGKSPPSRLDPDDLVRRRYDRMAAVYGLLGSFDLRLTRRWRRAVWSMAEGADVLEVGIGTGINLPFYPPEVRLTGIDVSPRMLALARRRLPPSVALELGDVQALRFAHHSFDSAVATFVFCSVPDPLVGLRERRRVLRPGGRLLLLEHVVSSQPWLASVMRAMDPLVAHLSGAHIARDTMANVRSAGFDEIVGHPLWSDVIQLIEARAPQV